MAYRTEIEKLEQRYAENPKQWFAALADAYRKQGDVDLAIEYVKGGIDERPDYSSAHIVLGRCYLDKDMDDEAARAFEQVLELDAENIIALKSLEEIAEREGDAGAALQWLSRLLEVDPMNEEAHESLVRLKAQEGAQKPEPVPDISVSEENVDASSVEIEPEMLDATLPMDAEFGAEQEETTAAIEPFELEPTGDASSWLAAVSEDDGSLSTVDEAAVEIGPIEIETEDADASSLLAGLFAGSEYSDEDVEPVGVIEPFELEPTGDASSWLAAVSEDDGSLSTADEAAVEIGPIELETFDADATALLADMPDEAESTPGFEATIAEIEPVELDMAEDDAVSELTDMSEEEESSLEEMSEGIEEEKEHEFESYDTEPVVVEQRLPVPPTKEVEAVDLEAMRASDEMIARATMDAEAVDDDEAEYSLDEAPRTTEIDVAELEKLRAADALVAGATVETLIPDGVEDDADPGEALQLIMPDDVGVASADTEPEPVVTETMAEVYAKQGLLEQAREIYEVLVMQHADDSRLKARLDELNQQAKNAIQETRQSRFSVTATGGESTVTYLQRIFTYEGEVGLEVRTPEAQPDSDFDNAPTPLEEAFADDPPEVPGEPTVVAADEVSLASVFDGGRQEPVSTDPLLGGVDGAPDEPDDGEGVSFDEFYGSEPRPSLPGTNGSPDDEKPPDDDDNFKNWLKGLKT